MTFKNMKIAYLVNQYPKVSHSFIRREIVGLEACGCQVARFSVRSCGDELVDIADKLELEKTRILLDAGLANFVFSLLSCVVSQPLRWLSALQLTFKIGWHSERGILIHLIYLAEACVLLRWVLKSGATHIHAHFGTNSTTVAMLCSLLGQLPYSFTVHGPEEFDKVKEIALTEKINRAAFVVAVSSFGKSQLYRWCEYEQWSKIHIVHCGVDNIFLNQQLTPVPDWGAERVPHCSTFVCVGRLCEQKGQLLLIEAAKQLASQGQQFKIVLVGDGSLRNQIEDLIINYGLENYIKITGWASTSEVQQYILNSRAMILPSFAEGLPVVIMEALALGRPVISTYVAGIPELIEPNICGWLVPPGSVDDLTEVMRIVLHKPLEELEKMGQDGAMRVAQQHNAVTEASKLADLFSKVSPA